ncbi:rho GDP dissociation inhibitor, partial [Spiromyces aspiralis]
TLDEYKNLDANDESLRKWKESLGLSTASSQLGDGKAQVVILSLSLEFENHPEIFIDLTNPNTLEDIKKKPIVLKAGESYVLKIRFKVLNDIVCGLKFLQVYKRAGFSSGTISEMIGSYSPSDEVYEKRFPKEV